MAEQYNPAVDDEVDVVYEVADADDTETETETEEEEEDEDTESGEEEFIPVPNSPRVSGNVALNSGRDSVDEGRSKRSRVDLGGGGGDTCSAIGDDNAQGSQGKEWNRTEIDGLFCPICMDAWTSDGDHHICCLPCGHLFGFSCISKWLKLKKSSAKCPQCNRRFSMKDVRKLFAPRIAVLDNESQKTIRSLEVKCAFLEKKTAESSKRESEWLKNEAELKNKVKQLVERNTYLEHVLEDLQSRSSLSDVTAGSSCRKSLYGNINSKFFSDGSSCNFVSEGDLQVMGASLFDIDAVGQVVLLVRRVPKISGSHILTKMNLLPPHESEDIFFPLSMKTIKDLHISPFNANHALCASLGKKLSVLSLESNSVILSYDLPAPAWSCCWDINCSYHIYAGLQDGSLMAFDVRQTGSPLESRVGLTRNPIHTLRSLRRSSSGVATLLSASSIGICHWNIGCQEQRPSLIEGPEKEGVCISLAYSSSSDDIVATFRPKQQGMSNETALTQQPSLSPSGTIGQGVMGSTFHWKRDGDIFRESGIVSARVSDIRLPKSIIIDTGNKRPVFGIEGDGGLTLQELPSFTFAQRLMSRKSIISDVRYVRNESQGLLGCLSEDKLQLFSTKL